MRKGQGSLQNNSDKRAGEVAITGRNNNEKRAEEFAIIGGI